MQAKSAKQTKSKCYHTNHDFIKTASVELYSDGIGQYEQLYEEL